MAGRKKKSAGRMPLWLYVLIVVAIALVTYFRTSGEPEGADPQPPAASAAAQQTPQPPAASAAAQQTPADETLTVRFLDVGQGDSILLACGDETMLIDGGPIEEGQFLVSRLNRLDVTGLTYVVNTHPDEDHCGGLAAVLAKYPAEHVYSSVTEYTTKVFSNVVKYADEQGHPVEVPQTGDSWTLGSASVQIIGPVQTYSDPNNGSLVLRVDYGGTSFLFTGDMEQTAEADLMDSGANVRADVLKVGHHGSPTSSSEAFLEAVAPSIAVISVGEDNDYGHPSADVLARLEALGTTIYRTDTQGEIIITSDGQALTVTTDPTSREPAAGKDAPFIGNRNSMIVHSANCAKLPGEDNRVYFNTAEEAEEYGYQKHTCIK